MSQNWPFKRNDVFPSWFANRIQDFLSAAETNVRLTRKDNTTVQVVPDTALGIAAVAIDGRWRFNTATVERAHPGGAKGTYVVWAVAEDSDVDSSPEPHSDHTKYTFELRVTSGAAPSGEGIDVVEKIGEVDWSGTEIETVRQTLNSVAGPMIADGALSASGDLSWKREASGAWVPDLKAKVVSATEIADSLKPSAGAAAGTEALRALGTSSSTATAGNDARLTDERTPKDNSVTLAKLVAAVQEALVPAGTILATGRSAAPTGYLLCDGTAVSRTTYAALFTAIGTTYGIGNGSTTFNLPDLRGRVPVGVDGTAGRLTANDALGNSGGAEKHTLVKAEMPKHAHGHHSYGPPSENHFGYFNGGGEVGVTADMAEGEDKPHNNMQPYQVASYMIKT